MAGPIPTNTVTRHIPMRTDTQLLTLGQWLSPAFPTGSFAYSHGLETAIHEGWIADADGLEDWLRDCLTDGSGRSDAIWLRLAHGADDPLDVDREARAFAFSRERLRESERQGAAFVATVNAVWMQALPDMLLPVAVGRAAKLCGLDADETVALYLQSFVTNLVLAAMRLCPIGQTAGQQVILALQPLCLDVANSTAGSDIDEVFGNAFLSDVAAMAHETLEPRLFQS